ncbi:TatD family hydrolase [Akkermansiaceae bacterium]|nr:TatD family hydrolase [Akkermansiaceae bacterium]
MIIDSHCHLASYKFAPEEISELIIRAKDHNVTQMITLATSLDDCAANLKLAEDHTEIFVGIGIHPCDVHEAPDDYMTQLETYAQHPRCVAIGETGLDFYHPAPDGWTDEAYHDRQRTMLDEHFQLAAKLGKNIVIHTRDKSGDASLQEAITIYKKYSDQVRAVFHCFPFSYEAAQPILDLGGLISFTGITTFKNAPVPLDTATRCPAGSFMLETDAPYLSPIPHRGKRNEPAFTKFTAEHIAKARGETLKTLAAHTTVTARDFYKIN